MGGCVCGATCAAPRKNRRRRIGASPSCRRRKLHHHTRRASERWAAATASGVPPTRSATRAAPSRRRTGSQKAWLCSSAQRGDAGPRGRRRASPAAWLQSKTTQQEIRVLSEAVGCEFGRARLSVCEVIFVRGSGVKTLECLGRGYAGPPLAAQMAALAAQGLQAQSGTISRSIPQI